MRFYDFLRTAILLFAATATVLATVAVAGAQADDDRTLIFAALAWWTVAAGAGLWLGRRDDVNRGIAGLLSSARTSPVLPELEPGAILFNRLWTVAIFTVAAGGVAFLVPQVPAIAAGYALVVALAWRKQPHAVAAIEGRDGVRFYVEHTSPFKPTRLIRTPGFRTEEPADPVEAPPAPPTRACSPRQPA